MHSLSSRPRWLRPLALANAVTLAWSLGLAVPAQALAHDLTQPRPQLGLRVLSPEDMTKIVGAQGIGHVVSLDADGGSTYPWEASAGDVNTGNGNKLTPIPIVGWTARGGLPLALSLVHNSEGTHNSELGQKWTHSFDLYLKVTSVGDYDGMSVHWGDDLSYQFAQNVDGSFSAPTGIHDKLVKNGDNTYTLTKPSQVKYHFKTNLYCDTITDPNGNAITIAYNTGNFVTTVTDPTGRAITLGYDTSNRINSVTDPLSRTWTLSYDASNNLKYVNLPTLSSTTYKYTLGYDTNHNITSLSTPGGRMSTFSYYASDSSLDWEQDAAGNRTTFGYTATGTTITDANSHSVVYTYTSGKVSKVTDASGAHEDYTYDSANNKTQVTDKRGYAWVSTFDSMGNVLTSKDPYLNVTTMTYNTKNRPLTVTDPLSHVVTNTYDTAGVNLTSVTDALSHATTFTYTTTGLLWTKTDALSHTTTLGYDTNGNVTSVADANSNTTTATYDALGRKTSQTDALTHATTTAYDAWERVSSVTTPAGTTSLTYDADGNVLTTTDPNSHTTTATYDADSRPLTVTKANGDVMTYYYDGALPGGGTVTGQKGLLSGTKDGNNHAMTFGYSVRDEKASASYADSTGESWTYWATGELKTHVDGKGQTITYGLDNAGKPSGITYPTGTANVSFGYDNAGRRTSMTDGTGTTGYTFDNANRLTQIASPGGTVGYGYDNANRRTSMTLSGVTGSWTYGYDNGNRLTSTTNPYSETATNSYDVANRLTQTTNGNSSVTTYGYDAANRPTDVWHKTSATVTLGRYQYTYNAGGLVTTRSDNDGSTTTFGYDNADQLTSESRTVVGAYALSYTYDHNGNRLTRTQGSTTTSYSYDAHDKLQSAGGKTYGYDSNGNCTSVTVSSQTTTLTYDAQNRVTGITYPSSATNTFGYNGLGLRVSKSDSSGAFAYVCDGTSAASPVLKDGAAVYTPGLSERRGTASKFTHADALGSTRGITDSTQSATDGLLFDAFGQVVSRTGTTPTPFGFVGASQYQADGDSGLLLLGHRYYDPSIGRFISSDPAHAGKNWYAYCDNNPLGKTDPTGLKPPPTSDADSTPYTREHDEFHNRPGGPSLVDEIWDKLPSSAKGAIVGTGLAIAFGVLAPEIGATVVGSIIVGAIIGGASAAAGGGDNFDISVGAATGAFGGWWTGNGITEEAKRTLFKIGLRSVH